MGSNERRVCEAVIRTLERRTGHARADVRFPELDQVGPPVDVEVRLGDSTYAIEHTALETFAEQTSSASHFFDLIAGLPEAVEGRLLSPGVFELSLPTDVRVGGRRRLPQARRDLAEWIVRQAALFPDIPAERRTRNFAPRGYVHEVSETLPGFPFEARLKREMHWSLSSHLHGRLTCGRFAPTDYKQQAIGQIVKALERKCPKLRECKMSGQRTVLVLEDRDLSLRNHAIIAEDFFKASFRRRSLPDEIYLVSTVVPVWSVWRLKLNRRKALKTIDLNVEAALLAEIG